MHRFITLAMSLGLGLAACNPRGICENPPFKELPRECEFVRSKDTCTEGSKGTFHPLDKDDDDPQHPGIGTCRRLGYRTRSGADTYIKP